MIFRPLLRFRKSELLDFLSFFSLTPSNDSTNDDVAYSRNAVRRYLMPQLSENAKEMMARIAANVAVIRDRHQIRPSYSGCYIAFRRSDILSSPRFAAEAAVYEANAALGRGSRLSRASAAAVIARAEEGTGSLSLSGLEIIATKDELRIYPELDPFVMPFRDGACIGSWLALALGKKGDALTLDIDPGLFAAPVIIRSAREGDVIELKGGRKKVLSLMKDQRVPYAVVIEDRIGIAAYLARPFGGRDRLSARLLGSSGVSVALALIR